MWYASAGLPGLSRRPPEGAWATSVMYCCRAAVGGRTGVRGGQCAASTEREGEGGGRTAVVQLAALLVVGVVLARGALVEQALDDGQQPTAPPRVAPVDELVGPAAEPAALDRHGLQARAPPQERAHVERAPARGGRGEEGRRGGVREGAQHGPRRGGAEGVPAVRLAERRGVLVVVRERVRRRGEPALVRLARRDELGRVAREVGREDVEEGRDCEGAVAAAAGRGRGA